MLDRTGSLAHSLSAALTPLHPAERLAELRRTLSGRIVFSHGFGVEGQLIFHWLCEQGLDIDVVTLDTGRLFPETYARFRTACSSVDSCGAPGSRFTAAARSFSGSVWRRG